MPTRGSSMSMKKETKRMIQNTKKWRMKWNLKKRDQAKEGPLPNILEVLIRHMNLGIY